MDRRSFLLASPVLLGGCVAVGGTSGPPAPAPVFHVGDRWVYNASDGYRVPVTWVETHEVTAADAAGITVRVTILGETMNVTRTERLRSPGVVAAGAVFDPTETRDFAPPLERYRFPLTPETSWTQDLRNLNPVNQLRDFINRYVKVGGYEKVTVPAGSFDALLMRTLMSVDENNPFRFPFQCNYETWWAPAVGAMVRMTKYATYREKGDELGMQIRAQHTLLELASFTRAPG